MFVAKNGAVRMPEAYLAGFEMFYPDGKERGRANEIISNKYGILGIFPGNPMPEGTPEVYKKKSDDHHEMEKLIFLKDINHLRRCDMVIANLNNLRGQEPDSGTVFECGAGYGMGMPVYAFVDDISPYLDKVPADLKKKNDKGEWVDTDGYKIENFQLPIGSMMSVPITIVEGPFEEACKAARKDMDAQLVANGYDPYVMKED